MIPYDDLVVALATWRARQGLPVAQPAGAAPTPPPPRAPAPPPAARTTPPSAPPRTAAPPRAPMPSDDFDDGEGALVEVGPYDVGDDYAVPFGGVAIDQAGESTAIGEAPEAPTEGLLVPKRGKRTPDR